MHAAILGVAMSLLGIQVGWDVNPDQSVVYVIQLDAGDMDRFRVDGRIDSDIPPQVKNVRGVRIEYAPLFPVPPVQALLPTEPKSPRQPLTTPSSEASKRQTQLPIGPQTKTSNPGAAKSPDFMLSPDERKKGKEKEAKEETPAGKSGHEGTTGKQKGPSSQVAAVPRSWLWYIVVLCTSVAGNVYLGWMWIETRGRYRRLRRQRTTGEMNKDE